MNADFLDQATDETLKATKSLENEVRSRAKPDQVQNPDGTWPQEDCEDCGNEIPKARLLACGSIRCVYCQTLLEKRRSGR